MTDQEKVMGPVIIDDPKVKDAMREAQRHPVRVDVPGVGHGYMVSDETLKLIRGQLADLLIATRREAAQQVAASGFTEADLKDLLPDYAGD